MIPGDSIEFKEKVGNSSRKRWEDPEFKEKHLEACRKSIEKKKLELQRNQLHEFTFDPPDGTTVEQNLELFTLDFQNDSK